MTGNQVIDELLAKRRDRAIAIILGVKERECDKFLSKESSAKLRKVVLDQVNESFDLVQDVLRSFDNGDVVLNEDYMRKLDEIHEHVVKAEVSG